MAKMNVFTYENLSLYDSLIKQYINAGDAKSIKKVTLEGRTLSFFKSEAEGATADFVVTIPETDLTALQNRIKANEEAIAAINNENTGLLHQAKVYADEKVKALADGAVADNTAAIEAINNADTGIAKVAKDYTDAQVKALTEGAIKTNADDIDALEGRATAVENRATALETTVNKLDGAADVEGSVKAQIAAAKTELEGKITASEYDDEELRGLISANADAAKAAQDDVDALAEAVADMYTNDDIDGKVKTVQDDVDALEGTVGELAQTVADNEADIEAKVKAISDDYLKAADKEALEKAIQDNADAIDAHAEKVDGVVETLVGEDAGKSVRTIANEELVKQLIPENAKESLDKLEEIAAWIQNHPDDAAAMNKAIEDLTALVGTLPEGVTATTIAGYVAEVIAAEKTRAEEAEKGLADRIAELETAVGEGGSVDSQIDAKIAELDADVTSATVEEGKGVQVQVVEVDGVITTVAVTGNFDNAYDAKGAATTAETNAKDYAKEYADGLADDYDPAGSAATAETNAKDHADDLNEAMDGRMTVVEGLVGEGYQAITEAEINALFA